MKDQAFTDLLKAAEQRAKESRRLPESTYRLQFHAGFTFRDATAIVPYLHDLGVTHLYASPYLRAKSGSTHGYDVIDHCSLNPEVGTREDFEQWVQVMQKHGMTHVLDTVPNHVGIATNDNVWWNDVLEHGPASRFGNYFDIAWRGSPRRDLHDRVLIPTLGDHYAKVLEAGELKIKFEADMGSFVLYYYERRFPIDPLTYDVILAPHEGELPDVLEWVRALCHRSQHSAAEVEARYRQTCRIKQRLAQLCQSDTALLNGVQQTVERLNGTPGDPRSFDQLDRLLSHQCYRLAYWKVASDEINYRRFFDVNDLGALAMERREVLEATHTFTLDLVARGHVGGLRIDHPDGLYDPQQYFQQLQQYHIVAHAKHVVQTDDRFQSINWADAERRLISKLEQSSSTPAPDLPLYVVAEKILGADEPLSPTWACHGTSGYDFLIMVNGLFVDRLGEQTFTREYHAFTNDPTPYDELVYRNKRLILDIALASELQMLAHRLAGLAQKDRSSRDFTQNGLRHALSETIACFPVYRSYITGSQPSELDREWTQAAIDKAIARNPKTDPSALLYLRDVLLQKYPVSFSHEDRAEQLAIAGKFQQLTAPVTAKGIEDTTFYQYNRLISLNEVGGEPSRFGTSPDDLHRYLADRQRNWPYAMSTLSTHDTKRSEDVRARINVLSEMGERWWQCVRRWRELNAPHRRFVNGLPAPAPDEEYLIYQSLIGAWPIEMTTTSVQPDFVNRIQAYMQKAMREAKLRTSWIDPNEPYESAVQQFVVSILSPSNTAFLASFIELQTKVSHYGLLNSLAQTLLRLTAPGVPDTYQGTELWDFSLVDPDNRRPVDYPTRQSLLASLNASKGSDSLATDLLRNRHDGRIKLWVTSRVLATRRDNPGLFTTGDYIPLAVEGSHADHLFCFARRHGGRMAIVIIPRLLTRLSPPDRLPIGHVWNDTRLRIPHAPRLRNVLTGASVKPAGAEDSSIDLKQALSYLPIALYLSE